MTAQLAAMRERYLRHGAERFIPYFQTFTNTDAPPARLRALWDEAVGFSPDVVGLAVGTRPDCVPDATLDLLASYGSRVRVHLELGLQSAHPETIARINRGHTFDQFDDAVRRAAARGIEVVAHVILGLPGETPAMMRETARALAALPIAGLKIHALLVLEGTALAAHWRRGDVPLPDLPTYAGWVADFLELLPPESSSSGSPPTATATSCWRRTGRATSSRCSTRSSANSRAATRGRGTAAERGAPPEALNPPTSRLRAAAGLTPPTAGSVAGVELIPARQPRVARRAPGPLSIDLSAPVMALTRSPRTGYVGSP